jgi:ferritin-like metal-binding protein YciE
MEYEMKNPTLEGLFHETLRDIYYAERKILKTLPKMMRAAQSAELKAAFEKHQVETEGQVERLSQVFELLGKRPQAKTCPAIDGIVEEGEEVMEAFKGKPALDAGLVAVAQAVEHYEIARYGTLIAWARCLGMDDAVDLLTATLDEEEETDDALSELAESSINEAAMQEAA